MSIAKVTRQPRGRWNHICVFSLLTHRISLWLPEPAPSMSLVSGALGEARCFPLTPIPNTRSELKGREGGGKHTGSCLHPFIHSTNTCKRPACNRLALALWGVGTGKCILWDVTPSNEYILPNVPTCFHGNPHLSSPPAMTGR